MWLRDTGVAAGDGVIVELGPEGPQRGDLAPDISAALEASPAAAACRTHRRRNRPARGRDQTTATKVDIGPAESAPDRRPGVRLADSGTRIMHEIIPDYAQRPAGIP
jgi:hypothetical protein